MPCLLLASLLVIYCSSNLYELRRISRSFYLSLFGKILEGQINSDLVKHVTSPGLFTDKQYGFYFCRSTVDVLTIIAEDIYQTFEKNGDVRAAALHISKTFGRV